MSFGSSRNIWTWPLAIACAAVMLSYALFDSVRQAVYGIDAPVALAANSLVGHYPFVDMLMAWLCTARGDVVVLFCVCLLLLFQSLQGKHTDDIVYRLAFWGWTGALCVGTYLISNVINVQHRIPIAMLSNLQNVQQIYHVTLRTDPSSSFPSGHAFAYGFFALMSWRLYPRISVAFGVLAAVMAVVRMTIGIHWLSDILLGGIPLAILMTTLAWETPLNRLLYLIEQPLWLMISKGETLLNRGHSIESLPAQSERAEEERLAKTT